MNIHLSVGSMGCVDTMHLSVLKARLRHTLHISVDPRLVGGIQCTHHSVQSGEGI